MPKPHNVYGKRPTAQQTLVASIFAPSSSPTKAPTSPERRLRDTPERRRRPREESASAVPDSEGDDDIASVLEELGELQLEPSSGQDETRAARVGWDGSRAEHVLKERDANTTTVKSPRRRRRKIVSSSPEPAVSDQEAHAALVSKNTAGAPGEGRKNEGLERPTVQKSERFCDQPHRPYDVPQRPYVVPETPTTPFARRRRLVQRKRQLSLTPAAPKDSLPNAPSSDAEPLDPKTAYAFPLLKLCNDPHITPFQSWANDLSTYFSITKVAEASYGEVYRLSLLPSLRSTSTLSTTNESVLKVIALKPPSSLQPHSLNAKEAEKQAAQSTIPSVANEVRLLQHMSPVPGFTNFRDAKVLQGRLPAQFVKAWKQYNKHIRESLFPDPSRKANYSEDQLWAVVEMEDAGADIEGLLEKIAERRETASSDGEPSRAIGANTGITPTAVWDIFWSVALAVAKGEEYAAFEHRDLHIGNVCVRPAASADGLDSPATAEMCLKLMMSIPDTTVDVGETPFRLGSTGLETTIIDYTLSRATIPRRNPLTTSPHSLPHPTAHSNSQSGIATEDAEEDTAFFDLSTDLAIFQGDADEEFQYEIYRYMRAAVLRGDPAASISTVPHPESRMKKSRGKKGRAQSDDDDGSAESDVRVAASEKGSSETAAWKASCKMTNLVWLHFVLFKLMEVMAPFCSGSKPRGRRKKGVAGDAVIAESGAQRTVRLRLQTLRRLLQIERMAEGEVRSAVELVRWAVDEEWLCEEDVVGYGVQEAWGSDDTITVDVS